MSVQDLPPEIFFRIFAFLPARDLAASVSRVCVYWQSFSADECLWKFHCLNRWGYWKQAQAKIGDQDVSWLNFFKFNCIRSNLSFLVLGAEGGGATDERLLDVQKKLKLGGLVNVDIFNVRTHTPTPDFLSSYNAVMFFSYHGFDQISIGNMLAEFVDNGGGVVFCAYANCGRGNRLEGKWAEKKYDPLTLGSTARAPGLYIGKTHDPEHPILDGVSAFEGGEQSSHGDGPVHPNATIIAEWNNGHALVVELRTRSITRSAGTIVGLNMYPPSSNSGTGGWNAATQGGRLMANAMHYVARAY